MHIVSAFSMQPTVRPLPVIFVSRGTVKANKEDAVDPNRALIAGMSRVIPQEYPGIRTCHMDVDAADSVPQMVVSELTGGLPQPCVALQKGSRFLETYVPVKAAQGQEQVALPANPVVLITGGLGHMGLHLAEALFHRLHARLVLLGRNTLPDSSQWLTKSEDAALPAEQRTMLKRLALLQAKRDDVLVLKADLNHAKRFRLLWTQLFHISDPLIL